MMNGRLVVSLTLAGVMGLAQTRIDLKNQGKTIDFSGATYTRPIKTGTSLPATCDTGDLFFRTNAAPGQNIYGCSATNTWTLMSGTLSTLGSSDGQLLSVDGQGGMMWRTLAGGPTGAIQSATTSNEYSVDIDPAVVPRKAAGETIGGLWEFDQGVVLKPQASPASPANGRIWYDGSLHKFRCQQNGVTVDCIGSSDAAQRSANLADLTNPGAARVNLGLGGAATLNVGTTAGTIATGDHTHSGYATLGGNGRVPASQLGAGTADASVFLRGDGAWTAPSPVSAGVGLNLIGSTLSINTAVAADLMSAQSFTGPKIAAPLGTEVAFGWAPSAAPSVGVAAGATYFSNVSNDPYWHSGAAWRRATSNPFTGRGQLMMSGDTTGAPAALNPGEMNQVLLAQGAGNLPAWAVMQCANVSNSACLDQANAFTGYQNMQSGSWRPPETTFSGLPAAAGVTGRVYVVTDSASASSCAAGGGSVRALCRSNGTSYEALGGGGGTTAFSGIASGENTTAALQVGTGASLSPSGSGAISANRFPDSGLANASNNVRLKYDTTTGGVSVRNAADSAYSRLDAQTLVGQYEVVGNERIRVQGRIGMYGDFGTGDSALAMSANTMIRSSSVMNDSGGPVDVGLRRAAAGVWEVNSGTGGIYRDLLARSYRLNPNADLRPTCDALVRGTVWQTYGGVGVKDEVAVCAKDASGNYAWRLLY
ncbi:MAG: hypothetical protein SFV54_24430 [Bryobacteraceae bacterium]|nr:hypothetical protein [Bryobacteraceae bacterium]